MNKIFVTGTTGFLGYHVIKRLNEQGVRPRALLPKDGDPADPALQALQKLDMDPIEGSVEDLSSLKAACNGVDTVLHLAFVITLGGGPDALKRLEEVNVGGTRNVLDAATEAKVARVVVSSSVLTVGMNRESQPLDETADWATHELDIPYAKSRREAELEALARPHGDQLPVVVVVNPAFTMGPEDFVGAPANKLVKLQSSGRFPITIPVGFGCLDVRDYADGVLRAAEKGRHGTRYILSSHNVMPNKLALDVTSVAGVKPPRWQFSIPKWLVTSLLTALELWAKLTRKPPKVSRSIVELWDRYAWYDAKRAHTDLGWAPRPLRETLEDTLSWLRANEVEKK